MRLVDENSAENYLRETARIGPQETVRVSELAGGVSNMVLLVRRPQKPGEDFVIKQARTQLRTRQAWFANVERSWREAEVLRVCERLLDAQPACPGSFPATTPRILFEDRTNYLFAMGAAPDPCRVWKQDLLAGKIDPAVARACGELLGSLHAGSWQEASIAAELGDRTLFEELRVDPYYRTLARAVPASREPIEALAASLAAHPRSLVHADFSPKNLLLFAGGMMMVDFETGHYGDPAFDLGFFLSHLVLKACYHVPRHAECLALSQTFRAAYDERLLPRIGQAELAALWRRGIQNFAGCAWARIDGKSPVEYLDDPARRNVIRALCCDVFAEQPGDWDAVAALCQRTFDAAACQLTSLEGRTA